MSALPQVLARRFLVVLFDTSSRRTTKKKLHFPNLENLSPNLRDVKRGEFATHAISALTNSSATAQKTFASAPGAIHTRSFTLACLSYVSAYYCVCVLILLCMCPHTTVCVLILLHVSFPTTTYLSSHYYICYCTSRELLSPVFLNRALIEPQSLNRACAQAAFS